MLNLRIVLITFFIFQSLLNFGQSTCANAPTIGDNSCITGQNFPGSVNMSGLCVGGNNPALYIKFVAGNCSEFTITPSGNVTNIGHQILTTGCVAVSGTLECHENVVANMPFSVNGINTSGANLLTSGTTYVLRLWGSVGTSTFNICYKANQSEDPSNECSGAISLGTTALNFYNGGDCQYTGSSTDATTSDPPAANLCAGSIENSQWIKFSPSASVNQFQITGSNINCTGGGCGFQFGIFSGSCSSLTYEGCYGNKVCSGGQSSSGPTNNSSTDGYSLTWSGTTTTGFVITVTTSSGGAFNGTEVFYLVMDGNSDADCSYTLQGTGVNPLPITLVSFDAYKSDVGINLIWSSQTEFNSSHFEIFRSVDALSFKQIGRRDAAGNSMTNRIYQFMDDDIESGIYYYMLKLVDIDGTFEFSKIITISIDDLNLKYIYYNLNGIEINFQEAPSGIYVKKIGNKYFKAIKF